MFDSAFFNSYLTAVGHGDLHGENIIVVGESESRRTFLIDFAHIGEQHVFLDYVIMEVSVRLHLLVKLLADTEPHDLGDMLARWMSIEEWLAMLDDHGRDAAALFDLNPDTDSLGRLPRLLRWIRNKAWLHGFNDSFYNYYGALGMAAMTSPFLPTTLSQPVRRAVRLAMLGCAGFSLERVQSDLGHASTRTPLSDAITSDTSADSFMAQLLHAGSPRIRPAVKAEANAFVLPSDSNTKDEALRQARALLERLNGVMPKLHAALLAHTKTSGESDSGGLSSGHIAAAFTLSRLFAEVATTESAKRLQEEVDEWKRNAWSSVPPK